jgi:hypothetical protein
VTFPAQVCARKVFSGVNCLGSAMKNPVEVLRRKEAELDRLQEEVDALRLVSKLLKERPPADQQQATSGKILQMP